MNTRTHSTLLLAAAALIAAPASLVAQVDMGTAVTYQGQLKYDGLPVTETVDFRFTLWDANTLGSPVGATLLFNGQPDENPPVAVVDGLFTVVLDFGPGIFTGWARWLEIEVRSPHDPDDTSPYTMLSPRQEMTPAAYALHTPSAASAPWDGLYNVPLGFADGEDNDSLGDLMCASGQVVKWDDLSGEWECADDLTGAGSFWSLSGNAGTSPGVDFLGTTDPVGLEIRVDNATALRVEPHATCPNIIGGISDNAVLDGAHGATIGGGGSGGSANLVTDNYGTIGGGEDNQAGDNDGAPATAHYATVGGGTYNDASGSVSTVGGGMSNYATNSGATVAGGAYNLAGATSATVSGGDNNYAEGGWSVVSGGEMNHATAVNSTVGGGYGNYASASYATVSGGAQNYVEGAFGTIAGGGPSDLGNPYTTNNRVFDDFGAIGGGNENQAGSDDADPATAPNATVSGGGNNRATGRQATVGGGYNNEASGENATIAGGVHGTATGDHATVGGGYSNDAGAYATVGGGYDNTASGSDSTVGGGYSNDAGGSYSAVGGGQSNTAGNLFATVGGGNSNAASGDYAVVAGGHGNTASGLRSTVPGGLYNKAGGHYSFAAGRQAKVRDPIDVGGGDTDGDEGTFVWADSTAEDFTSTGPNQFLIRASGGVGIGTADPDTPLHVAADWGQSAILATNDLVDGSGRGVKGVGGDVGVVGEVTPTGAYEYDGVAGWVSGGTGTNNGINGYATGAGTNRGVYGLGYGGSENYGGYFISAVDSNGIGVKGVGALYGVEGVVNPTGSATYTGVHGSATGGTGTNYGVYAYADGDDVGFDENMYGGYFLTDGDRDSAAVIGENGSSYDAEGRLAYVGTNLEFPLAAGVYGAETTSGYGYAGYFSGDVEITGNLNVSGASKNFKIDHPLDPANKYLYHACVESDERLNVYNGNVALDGGGEAVVELPAWFEALNRDFRYQLTAVGAPGPNLYVAREIKDNHFTIAGGKPGMKVSWQVTGIRNDPCAAASPFEVEVDKPEAERGTYLAPEAWGQSEEMGLHYEDRQKRGSRLPDRVALEETK